MKQVAQNYKSGELVVLDAPVPVEMSENSDWTRTPPGRHAGTGASRTVSSPDL